MNKVEKVSIGGYAFTLDEDAHRIVKQYIEELETHYSGVEGGRDILEGMEERIAELLLERCGRDGVINSPMALDVISILGRPEAIDSESDTKAESGKSAPKRLYRDLSARMISGVCSGLGAYTGMDTALWRLAFVTLTAASCFFGRMNGFLIWFFPFIYCVLWICMPGAKTVQQRYAMRGEDISLEGMKKTVQYGDTDTAGDRKSAWPVLWRWILIFFGLILLLAGVCGLTAGAAGLIGYNMPAFSSFREELTRHLNDDIRGFSDMIANPWIAGMALMILFLPLLAMLYEGLHLVLGFKSPRWHPGLCLLILWLICSIALGILLIMGGLAVSGQLWV